MIHFNCPRCGKAVKVDDDAAGKKGKCSGCGEIVGIPVIANVVESAPILNSRVQRKATPLVAIVIAVAVLVSISLAAVGFVVIRESGDALGYKIRSIETPETPGSAKVLIEAVLTCPPEAITEATLRHTIRRIHRQAMATRFTQHARPTLISIRLFTSADRHNEQYIASCFQAAGDTFQIEFDQGELADLRTPPEERFGLSEDQRKAICWELWVAETRASSMVSRQIPPYGAYTEEHINLENELNRRFEKEIQDRYGLTAEQIDAIESEGLQYSWTHPAD